MGRATNKLSVKFVEKNDLKPGLYGDGGGLYLQVSDFKTKAWVFRFMIAGHARKMGLGDFELVSLKDARKKRDAAYGMVVDGVDPIEERQSRKAAQAAEKAKVQTFGECATGYFDAHKSGWKNQKHIDQWQMTVLGIGPSGKPAKHDYCKPIRSLNVAAIETAHVMQVLQPIWSKKNETASRIRGRIEDVLDRAKVLELRSGENPARWVGHLDQLLPAKSNVAPVENQPALPYEQMPEFMAELRKREGIAARALEFTILTACRTGDTIGAPRKELNRRDALWTIDKSRLKGKKGVRKYDHVVPLTKQALAVLDAIPEAGDYLFPGGKEGAGLSNAAMAAVIDRMNEDRQRAGLPKWIDPTQDNREIVPHGFRSTFKDWAGDVSAYPNEMSEMALAHAVSDKTERAYRRSNMREKRRRMMADWAVFCGSPVKATGDNVVAMRGAAK